MLIAQKTLESNIAEHVVYMFQIEDLIRAHNHDLETILNVLIYPQIEDEELRKAYEKWYAGLIQQMKREKIVERGHLSNINEILMELLMLHNTMLNIVNDATYKETFEKALPALKDFQQKSNAGNLNLIEVGFNALYSKMLLKLKGQKFSSSTEEAFASISKLLGTLAVYYKKMKNGELDFASN